MTAHLARSLTLGATLAVCSTTVLAYRSEPISTASEVTAHRAKLSDSRCRYRLTTYHLPLTTSPAIRPSTNGEVHMVVLVMPDPGSRAHEGHLLQDDITTRRVSEPVPQLGREDDPIDAQALAVCGGF
jgi:hypothetical protein